MDPSSYLRPKAPRRDYYSQERAPTGPPAAVPPRPGAVPTVEQAIHGLLQAHATDWSSTTLRNARHYLLLNRFPAYCAEKRIVTIDQLTTGHIEEFLAGLSRILKAETLVKYRTYLRALARFCAETPGYPSPGLADVERLPVPRIARRKLPVALTKEQEVTVLEAAAPGRDQLIVETLLACGVRVSELCALLVSDLVLDHRPPYIHVRGTVYDRDLTKSEEDRNVPFRVKYATLPRRLHEYIATQRDTEGARGRQEVFLSERRDAQGRRQPLTPGGVQQLMERIARVTGIHCNPHKLRHTWATRCVDSGIPMFHLQQAGGWKSIEMVRRYYSANAREMLSAFERAHED